MLRPEPMTRVLVAGPNDQLERFIETLYELKLVHLVDHRGEDEMISIGKPLAKASEVSEDLVKLRSIANILNTAEADEPAEPGPISDIRGRIAALEVNLREEDDSRKKAEALLHDLEARMESLRPFAKLGLPLETYRGYDSVEVIVGRVADEVRNLESVTAEFELVQRDDVLALFTAKEHAEKLRGALVRFGFTALDIPEGEGNPGEILSRTEADRGKWTARLAEINERLTKVRNRYAKFIVKVEDLLQVEIEKAEAPLRFAASEHSFVVDGWVPTSRVEALTQALVAVPGIHAEVLESDPHHAQEEAAPPILLRNRGPAKRFEILTNLFSPPDYQEIDPTAFLFLLFPVFFGLMIGDVGYGIIMVTLGIVLSIKLRDNRDFADLMRIILYGGLVAFFFGLFVFGDMFGIPFHAPHDHPEEANWSAIFGYVIPYQPLIHKLDPVGVIDMLLISIFASFVHLSLGFTLGFVNEIRHNKKHAASRIGWLFVLVGLFGFFAVLARGNHERVANILFFDQPPIVWIPAEGILVGGMQMPFFSIGAIIIGLGILIPSEGPLAPLEIISLFANMMSYTRLAVVSVAKGAVALAFNTMLLPLVIGAGANALTIIIGFVLLFLAHAMVLILGAMSAGIQAIRLNYVEFFLKFYKGGGVLFSPFGARKAKTEA